MLTSLFTAVSGMNANGTALSVIGDNVANMNTHGFKSSRAAFGDILSQNLGTSQVGRGVCVGQPCAAALSVSARLNGIDYLTGHFIDGHNFIGKP